MEFCDSTKIKLLKFDKLKIISDSRKTTSFYPVDEAKVECL